MKFVIVYFQEIFFNVYKRLHKRLLPSITMKLLEIIFVFKYLLMIFYDFFMNLYESVRK
jgi:hypothetical protein